MLKFNSLLSDEGAFEFGRATAFNQFDPHWTRTTQPSRYRTDVGEEAAECHYGDAIETLSDRFFALDDVVGLETSRDILLGDQP